MKVIASGIIVPGLCSIKTEKCVAKEVAPITVIWAYPGRKQINVCRPCLIKMIRDGEWDIEGTKVEGRKKSIDIAVFDSAKNLQLIVEIKNRLRASPSWARKLRDDMLNSSIVPMSPYFMLALPDTFYLWKITENEEFEWKIPAEEIITPYIEKFALETTDISVADFTEFRTDPYLVIQKHYDFEQVVAAWLNDMIRFELSESKTVPDVLISSGLYEVIKNGSISIEAVVEGSLLAA